jgi:hypothetical protein
VARVRGVQEKPSDGAAYRATRDRKEQPDFVVAPVPKGRLLTSAGAADSIAVSLSALTLDDVQKSAAPADAGAARALFRTFDGLEIEVTGRKDGARGLITLAARATGKDAEAEAHALNTRLAGWEFEIPEYKYGAIFRTLEDLLQPKPAAKPAAAKPAASKAPGAGGAKPAGK